ncbi:MAG: Rrf2 family transcriptional regulator [Rhizobium sp.]|nr:Rrf2 family transcriptional regulator [Rhizobium sp.]
MRLTTRTNLAIRTLMFCAVNAHLTVRKSDIAAACNASENHLAQVIRTLGKHDYIDATRGRHGGLQLMRPPSEINIGGVFRLFEAELPFAECFSPANTCPLVHACWLRNAIHNAVEAFYASLDKVRLSDLVEGNDGLTALLRFHALPGCSRPAHDLPISQEMAPVVEAAAK